MISIMENSAARKGSQSLIQGLEDATVSAMQHTRTKASDRHSVEFDLTKASNGAHGVVFRQNRTAASKFSLKP